MKLLYILPILVGVCACEKQSAEVDIKIDGTSAWTYSANAESGRILCSMYDDAQTASGGNGWLNFEDTNKPCEDAKVKPGEWAVQFNYGVVKGAYICSAKSGDKQKFSYDKTKSSEWSATEDSLKTASGKKQYCWCKPYGLYDSVTDVNIKSVLGSVDKWIFVFNSDDYACDDVCAGYCATAALFYPEFRRASFK